MNGTRILCLNCRSKATRRVHHNFVSFKGWTCYWAVEYMCMLPELLVLNREKAIGTKMEAGTASVSRKSHTYAHRRNIHDFESISKYSRKYLGERGRYPSWVQGRTSTRDLRNRLHPHRTPIWSCYDSPLACKTPVAEVRKVCMDRLSYCKAIMLRGPSRGSFPLAIP